MRPAALVLIVVLGGCRPAPVAEPTLGAAARDSIAAVIRAESDRMLVAMRERAIDSVLQFYGRHTAYAGNGAIGDWDAIVAGAGPRYRAYTKVDCRWGDGFKVDVLARTAAVVTAVLICEKADSTGKAWREDVARTEVMVIDEGRWRIVALHESTPPGGFLK